MTDLTAIKAAAWDRLMASTKANVDDALMEAWQWYTHATGLSPSAQGRIAQEALKNETPPSTPSAAAAEGERILKGDR